MPLTLLIVLRGTLSYFTLLILTRLMGKKQVGQLTFFDYATGISIGSMAAGMTEDINRGWFPSALGLLVWTFWVLVTGSLSLYSRRFSRAVDGEPTIVIQNGQILESNLEQLNYNIDDLRMQLRQQKAFNISDVEFAILEPNGKLSVLKKSQLQPVTPADLNIPTSYKGLAVELVLNGKIIEENLKQINLSRAWLEDQIHRQGHSLKDIFYAEIDTDGKLYIDLKGDLQNIPQEQDITEK